ncbi:DUF7379 domain-containing protein [Paraflavitalea pollutisoli]|uniref:DUF7379 domain-containing protein n=1 Tax=Paraflavitalea pollutisoli TaxID=3034143 RepID=UPI0023EAFBA1|nr:CHAT domain-containing protein [Paraflavitalea sp. H1-2-19X]
MINKISVIGEGQALLSSTTATDDMLVMEESYRVGSSIRGAIDSHTVDLSGGRIVELIFEDNTTWLANADTLEEIFPEAAGQSRAAGDAFVIPFTIKSNTTERGIASDIALRILNVFKPKVVDNKVRELAEKLEKKQLETDPGIYRIDPNFQLQKFVPEQSDKPWLLFLHGTNSSTIGSFGELNDTSNWTNIKKQYGSNILGYQHLSLTQSPLQNVLELVQQLPKFITLDLVSHSRGGLVGDILARFCTSNDQLNGFSEEEIQYLRDEGREEDVQNINDIGKALKSKKIVIRKFVRVACPASGTTLASKRLDNFFNITFNLIGVGTGLATTPVYIAFKNLIAAVISTKNNVEVLPGVEAMNPQSPFIKVLNNPNATILPDQPLIILSGNCKAKFNLKGLLIIASKLFYAHRNDLVVNTASMYRGAKRRTESTNPKRVAVQYFFDEGTDVDHFHYFENEQTRTLLERALEATGDTLIPGFRDWRDATAEELDRNALLKLDGGKIFMDKVTGLRPILVIMPGIMGSNLDVDNDTIWINYGRFLTGGLRKLDMKAENVKANSIVATSYARIAKHFSESYDVVTFAFDWRRQLNQCAKDFAAKVEELLKFNQPIHIIGHSMGGVLVRDFIITQPDVWKQLNASPGFRLIFLGSPLGGSFRIPAVLMGKDGIIDKLSKIDLRHNKPSLLKIFYGFPGLASLLPLSVDDSNNFADPKTWNNMRTALNDERWPKIENSLLTEFRQYRDQILASMDDIDYSNITYIAGKDKATVCGYRIDQTSHGQELVFLSTAEGDQSVTWESGIPKKMIRNNSVYYVDVSHGALANEPSIFKGFAEILKTGNTNLLSRTRPVVRGEEKRFVAPVEEDFDTSPAGVEMTLLGISASEKVETTEMPINVRVSQGHLRYAEYPLIAGHFAGDGILYAERAINGLLMGALQQRHQLGLYPGEVGTAEVLVTGQPDFKGAIIVGLGKPGELTAYRLTLTTEQGVSKYLINVNSKLPFKNYEAQTQPNGISSLAIGCGYGGLSVANSLRAIIQGVSNANQKVKELFGTEARTIDQLEFVEQYEDRALNCYYALKRIEMEESGSVKILTDNKIQTLPGSRKKMVQEAADEWWIRITITYVPKDERKTGDISRFVFSASTGAAREEQRELYVNSPVIQELIADISTNNQWSPQLAKTIFELLIPNDFKEQLKRQSNINWILDKTTAGYPWELLQDTTENAKPLCVNAGMIRQLTTTNYRLKINAVMKDSALVIGDPDLKGFLNQLPGALAEALSVKEKLEESRFTTTSVLKGSGREIIEALFRDDYKIIHLAGHGLFDETSPASSGMVIGNKVFLTPVEICQMSSVPELVFINCCFLGKTDGAAEEYYRNRFKMAANIGTQLIENGVKAVVAAGWAIDDAAAKDFTEVFYDRMLAGENFGDAVHTAREHIYAKYKNRNNTWGAYQCYGDPFYTLRIVNTNRQAKYRFIIAEEAELELYNLRNELQMGNYPHADYLDRVAAISKAVDDAGIRNVAITESEAIIYADLYEYDLAMIKYETLSQIENATYTFAAMEKYCSVRSAKCIIDFAANHSRATELLLKMEDAIGDLQSLLKLGPTAERYNLLGTIHQQKAILATTKTKKVEAYKQAAGYYYLASALKSNISKTLTFTNWITLSSILVQLKAQQWGATVKSEVLSYALPEKAKSAMAELDELKKNLQSGDASHFDHQRLLELAHVDLTIAWLQETGPKQKAGVEESLLAYSNAFARIGSKGKKMAEIEYISFLLDALKIIKPATQVLTKALEQLKQQLERMI